MMHRNDGNCLTQPTGRVRRSFLIGRGGFLMAASASDTVG